MDAREQLIADLQHALGTKVTEYDTLLQESLATIHRLQKQDRYQREHIVLLEHEIAVLQAQVSVVDARRGGR